ncbi:MAG: hypothetical protein PHH73_00115 [Candidatus Rickettsiella isopodorum]|nr:hypothetical protein [Candidatus Rickettsiella isopodorum]
MIKTYSDIVNDIATRLKITTTTEKASIKNWVNLTYRNFQIKSNWYWRKRYDILQLTPLYKDGTIDVTQNSRNIVGSGTAWTSDMVGRYIKLSGGTSFYKIIAVSSATSITIDQSYIDDTATSQSYYIWKRFYTLPYDVDELLDMYLDLNGEPLNSEKFYTPFVQGDPSRYIKAGIDPTVVTYTTGTVSGTVNTKTITGVGTNWIANVKAGDLFTPNGGSTYNVLSVDSDTQLTLVQNLTATVTALATYSIQRQDLIQIEFDGIPTEARNIHFSYLKKTFDMMNDNDEPEIPLQYRGILITGTIPITNQYLSLEGGELKQQFTIQIYEKEVSDIKDKVDNESNEPSGFYWGDD